MSWLLDSKGLGKSLQGAGPLLYGIRLPRVGRRGQQAPALLDKDRVAAMRLIRDSGFRAGTTTLYSLQHRRDVAGLTVMYKVHQQRVPHLHTLRQPLRGLRFSTRAVALASRPSYYSPDVVLGTTSVSSSVSTLAGGMLSLPRSHAMTVQLCKSSRNL
ncbi:hypothetical protein GWK47_051734 [Chionoecetes opilio]|uniref:Uncharacterized protein n=1 Tax=Chionoecetes opilio TaxID=41210 RepID=A0A8J4Y233_CHIOP|nr:hypothetical protein GWK47_051734 [Chionoecetes opilio]